MATAAASRAPAATAATMPRSPPAMTLRGQGRRAEQETGPAGVDTVLEDLGVEHPDPDHREVHSPVAGDASALLGAADEPDPYVGPHAKVEQGGGIRAGHYLVQPRGIGPSPANDRHPVLVGVEAVGARDAGDQLHAREQDSAELPARC